jgi:predicted nucleic acid-binding protein
VLDSQLTHCTFSQFNRLKISEIGLSSVTVAELEHGIDLKMAYFYQGDR